MSPSLQPWRQIGYPPPQRSIVGLVLLTERHATQICGVLSCFVINYDAGL